MKAWTILENAQNFNKVQKDTIVSKIVFRKRLKII